ncbi:ATP-grasp domain-containing protein [bacterium]|nr:ATP-grasp domain-containing protein [bacterium]
MSREDLIAALRPDKPTLVVVDGLSSGADYARKMRELFPGANVVHIQSSHKLPQSFLRGFGFTPADYDALFVHDGTQKSLDRFAHLFEPFKKNGLGIVVGSETGVIAYDHIADALGLENNDPIHSLLRRDKELMAAGVAPFMRTIPGKGFTNADAALKWIAEQHEASPLFAQEFLDFPLFVKPSSSAGSFGGHIVRSVAELKAAFLQHIGKKDPLGNRVERLLVQPNMRRMGVEEYAIDVMVDAEAGVVLTDIFHYGKREVANGSVVYETTRLKRFDPQNALHQKFNDAVKAAVKGLKIAEGPVHLEFFAVGDAVELYFIEGGARPAGGGLPQLARACGANDQILLRLLSLFDRPRFLELAAQGPVLKEEGMQVMLGSEQNGIITYLMSDEELRRRVPGLIRIDWHSRVGDRMGAARDMFSSPGLIFIKGTPEEIDAGYAVIRELEAAGKLYTTRPVEWTDRLRSSLRWATSLFRR